MIRSLAFVAAFSVAGFTAGADDLAPRFELASGFEIALFADDSLAHDIFALTFNSRGEVVVSGPGYVKTLLDDNRDGRADRAVQFSSFPVSGAQGLCFDGNSLYVTGDGVLARLTDDNGDGVADGRPQILARLRAGEHGAHAILLGPDGWLYVMCGNDSGVTREHARTAGSPIREPRCGAVLRVSRDGRQSQVIAHGFRNPYDMAFTATGQIFTVDSDGERDHHLPWYAPTRLFDVGIGLEHGWLAGGWTNSWSRPEYVFDSLSRAAELGRGSPTGIVCYRHRQFPSEYVGGLFAADWTFGRVYFLPLSAQGSTFRSQPQVFLQSRGEDGFAPVDLAVSPQGELFVAIGGRRTQGGVFRIVHRDGRLEHAESPDPLLAVLTCDDPLSSWARRRWEPLADQLGPQPFCHAVLNAQLAPELRVRAVEVLVDRFAGIDAELARRALAAGVPALSARIAWAISRSSDRVTAATVLTDLAHSADPTVGRAAWEGLLSTATEVAIAPDYERAMSGDRRVWLLALHLAARSDAAMPLYMANSPDANTLAASIVAALRAQPVPEPALRASVKAFESATGFNPVNESWALDALRVIQIALGDIQIEKSSPAEPVGYVGRASEKWSPEQLREVGQVLASRFPTRWPQVDYELARTLAMFECDDARLPERFSQCWNEESLPAGDLHYLFALSRLAAPRCNEVTHRTAAALLALHRKLRLREELVSRFWPDRVMELTAGLCRRDPALPAAIVDAPAFELMDHALFTVGFEPPLQQRAARRLLAVLQRSDSDDAPRYSDELIRLVASLPIEESLPVLRRLWDEQGASRRIAIELAARAELADRNRLIAGLAMLDDDAVAQCARALARLSGDESNDDLTAAARALGRYCDVRPLGSPKENQGFRWPQTEVRQALLALFEGRSGRQFLVDESSATDLRLAYRPVFEWLKQDLPEAYAQIGLSSSATDWLSKLSQIDWSAGNAQRGQVVFEKQSCHRCHGEVQRAGNQRLGPDLAGAAERFSRDDLFVAIVNPSASVAPAYRTTQLATRDGRAFHGLIVYESPDGTLLQTGPDTIIRVTGEELLWMEPGDRSLMPDGLLNGLADGEIADLYAYLKTLQAAR